MKPSDWERQDTFVYVVYWPVQQVLKIGRSFDGRRARKFTARGARVLKLIEHSTESHERELLTLARDRFPRAFNTWQDGVPLLGAGGIGFTECYSAAPDDAARFVLEAT